MEFVVHNPLSRLIVQIILILVSTRLVGLVMRLIGQPQVIAEVVGGILLGPSLLGWLFPSVERVLFTPDSMQLLSLISQLGLVLFIFLIGLELDPKLMRGRGHTSIIISHTSIVVPFALGAALAVYLYPHLAPPGIPRSSFLLFMGLAMSITAFPVLARILSERRLTDTPVGALTITCAAVDDVTAWCLLAFVVSLVGAAGIGDAVRTTALALLYIAGMWLLVRPFMRRFGARIANREGLTQNVVAAVLLLLLVSSWATELIGIHALFGAFLFGVVMPREGNFIQVLAEKIEDLVLVLLLPLFFAFSGLRTEIGLLSTGSDWLICGLITLVACAGKFGGCTIAARLTGTPWREAAAMGVLVNTRGLMELVVLNIGLDLGVISPQLFTMMVIMALVTTFMTAPLLDWIYPPERLHRLRLEEAETAAPALAQRFTALLCVAYDRSGPGLLRLGTALTAGNPDADRLYALRLLPPTDRASFYVDGTPEERGAAALSPLLKEAKDQGREVRPLAFVSSSPADDICGVAYAKQADLILLGWHKPLLGDAILGGTVRAVMRKSPACAGVLVDRGLSAIQKVLVAYRGGLHDRAALRLAQRLRSNMAASVTILHVIAPGQNAPSRETQDFLDLTFPQSAAERGGVYFKVIAHADPARAIIDECATGYDLAVVGLGSEGGLPERSLGFRSEYIAQHSPASLLIVRGVDLKSK